MFHRILPKALIGPGNPYAIRGTLITLEFFIQILNRLKTREVISLEHFHKLQVRGEATGREIVITIDDGYQDTWAYAMPLLKEYGYPATLFPVLGPCLTSQPLPIDLYYHLIEHSVSLPEQRVDYVRGVNRTYFNSLNPDGQWEYCQKWLIASGVTSLELIPEPLYMSLEQLNAWTSAGFAIGGHTTWHAILPSLAEEEIVRELEVSKAIALLQSTGSFLPFAYPDGQYNPMIMDLIQKSGFHMAVTVEKANTGRYAPFEVPRLFMNPTFDLTRL